MNLTRRQALATSTAAGALAIAGGSRIALAGPGWSAPVAFAPEVAIHLSLLPGSDHLSAKLLSYGKVENPKTGKFERYDESYVIAVPTGGVPLSTTLLEQVNPTTQLFCSGQTFLTDGRLITMGGHIEANYHGSADVNTFTGPPYAWHLEATSLNAARWYPSVITLPSGEVLVLAGSIGSSSQPNTLPQVWQPASATFRNLTSAIRNVANYPKLFISPNGRVFMAGPAQVSAFLDVNANAGKGAWINGPRSTVYRTYGIAAQYAPGKILVAGGGGGPSQTAEVIDLNVAAPKWRTVPSMAFKRRHANATVLPDGTVLVTGGTASVAFNDATNAVFAAELWNPTTERFTTLGSGIRKRVYHSSSLLLPDGRVIWTGGGSPAPKNGVSNHDCEIFSPPNLSLPRPQITSCPTVAGRGQTISIGTPSAVNAVTLMRIGSVTHTVNFHQLRVPLVPSPISGGVAVTLPNNPVSLPSGHYLTFALNVSGTPSVARMLRIV